jgi:hypothetical protein
VYDAAGNQLSCASCSTERENASGVSQYGAALPQGQDEAHPMTWMSADGDRVFFESASRWCRRPPMVLNVYEWERDGAGECDLADGLRVSALGW